MKNPSKLSTMDKLGLQPATSKMEEALRAYALQVMQGVDTALVCAGDTKDQAIVKINAAKDWIAQEQLAAFRNSAPVHDCVKWVVQNLNDPRKQSKFRRQ